MKLTGNTIFLTGGTSGIGLGLALRFRALGNKVIISGRRKELLDSLAAEYDGLETVELDVADPDSIDRAFDQVTSTYPDLNVLITMAGIMQPEDLTDPDHLRIAEETININLLGTIRTATRFTSFLTGKPNATILTVSSGLAFVPLTLTPTYSAAKAAVHSYTQSLRNQLAPSGVQVIELAPPAVRTALMNQENAEHAMPLDDYLTETMDLLRDQPDAAEILVDNVGRLRFAEPRGNYEQIFTMLNGAH